MKKLLSTTALAAALAVALALASMAYAHEDEHGKDGKGRPHFMDKALSKLPAKDAAKFRETMKEAHEKNMALFDQLHKLHDERRAILTAPQFDKDAYLAKGDELKKLRESVRETARENEKEAFVSALGELSQEERKTLASAMDRMHHGHGHHWGHDKHGDHEMHKDADKHSGKSSSDSE